MKRLGTLTAGFVLLVLMLGVVPAWTQSGTASVTGTVIDPGGGVLPGANVTLTHDATSAQRSVETNDSGLYRFAGLPPGGYTMEVTLEAFSLNKWNHPFVFPRQ